LSKLVGPAGRVLVSDLAPGMVEVAARRNAGFDNVSVGVLDASAIDQPPASFDVVLCRMGLMFTPEPEVAFAEIHRILVPGGRLAALTWGGLEHNPWMTCVGMAAMMAGLVTTNPPVGPGGIFSLGDPERLAALARAAGLVDVTVEEHPVAFRAENIDEHVARVIALAGPIAVTFQAVPADQLAAVRRSAAQLAAQYITADGVEIPGRALLVSAHTPAT
jgi:SAM-dependent methyltransferase